jgi:hypothetical protein
VLVCIIVCSFVAVVILEYGTISYIISCRYSKKILCVYDYTLRTVPIKKDLAKKTVFSYTSLSSSLGGYVLTGYVSSKMRYE